VLIQRGGDVLVPRGGTHLAEGDTLLALAESIDELKSRL
jgi:Trk K+ transport system NAD-binding subunit